MKNKCLNENELMEFFYMDGEIENLERYSKHVENCNGCNKKIEELSLKMSKMDYEIPQGGDRALNRVLSSIGLSVNEVESVKNTEKTDIMTIFEVLNF